MPSRLPQPADFPQHLTVTITPPPPPQHPTSILILLHGLGDTHIPFTRLAQQLRLPNTACLAVRAPTPLPDALGLASPGWHWGDDVVLDSATGAIDVVHVPYRAGRALVLDELVRGVLVRKCGYALRDVMLFGFGQGGALALGVACEAEATRGLGKGGTEGGGGACEMGGIVSVGGPLPSEFGAGGEDQSKGRSKGKAATPVLVLGGARESAIGAAAEADVKRAFEHVEVHRWAKTGDGMPANRDEMLPIMRFFARRLRSRAGVPSDAVEIT